MSRREIVLLVSRAIAVFQGIAALMETFIYLPQEMFLLTQRFMLHETYPGAHTGLSQFEWIGLIFGLLRLGILVLLTVLFWKCGPMIERLLSPEGSALAETQEAV